MQKIRIDFDNPGLPQHISAVENDSQSRFFQATLYENGKAYTAPAGASYSIMYCGFGPQNQGWYDTINDGAGKRAACKVSGNVVTCEIARQALQVPGHVSIVLCVTTGKGYMLKSWPIECNCKNDRYDSTAEIQSFFYVTQVSNADWTQAIQAVEELKNIIDPTLSLSGKAADAKATGAAVDKLEDKKADKTDLETERKRIDVLNDGGLNLKDEVIDTSIKAWLADHPEATTTVQDYSLTFNKMVIGTLGYVTPEMFGAKGDGVTDDTEALLKAIPTGYPIREKTGSKYSVKSQLVFSDNCIIENIHLVAGAEIESVIKYSKRNTIIRNVQIDCNNLANYGILGASNVPTDTTYYASIEKCSVVNALIDGYNTGSIRTFMNDCNAKWCGNAGFYIDASDTKHDNLVPIDCKYGVYVNSSNTSISRFHPWSWEKEQIGLFVGTNCSVSIAYFFNDTNQYAIIFSAGVDITIGTLRNFNNINAPSAISDGCRMLTRNKDTNTYIPYITIGTICGTFIGYDDYFLYPDNYEIGYMSVQRVNLTDVNTRFDKKMFRLSYVPPSLYDKVLKKFNITSNVLTISSCTMQRCRTDLNGYEIRLQVGFETSNATLEPLNEILNIQYIGDDTDTVYYKLLGADASFTALSLHTARKTNDDNKLKGMTLKCNDSFSLDGILILYLDLYVELYR